MIITVPLSFLEVRKTYKNVSLYVLNQILFWNVLD